MPRSGVLRMGLRTSPSSQRVVAGGSSGSIGASNGSSASSLTGGRGGQRPGSRQLGGLAGMMREAGQPGGS